ncbi:MAG: EAL domain-containing protein [Sulfurimonas sp.]|nr:EAL domain-containing protein [Sulfurimonas sp.]
MHVDIHKAHLKSLTLLYIEDHSLTSEFVLPLLKDLFSNVVFATNAVDGLELYQSKFLECEKSFDIVLCAMDMQKMNGFEVTKRIKEYKEEQLVFTTLLRRDSALFSDALKALFLEIAEKVILLDQIQKKQFLLQQKNNILDEYVFTTTSDMSGRITDISQAYLDFTGYTKDEVLGKNHSIFRNHHLNKKVIKNLWETLLEDKIWKGELRNSKSSGEEYWIRTIIKPLYSEENIKIGYLAIKEDITTKKRLEELSTKDQLTMLHNRRHFEYFIKKELNRSISQKNTIALLNIEIDYYQEYKNTFGYSKAYKLLLDVSNLLKTQVQTHIHHIFKISELEFAIVITNKDDAFIDAFAQQLLDAVAALHLCNPQSPICDSLTLSIGAVNIHTQHCTITSNDLYNVADTNLAKARENGGNTFVSHVNEEYIKNLKNIDNITKLPNRSALVHELSSLQEEAMLIILHINQLCSLKELYGFDFASNVLATKAKELQDVLDPNECELYNLNLQEFAILIHDKNMFYKYLLLLQHSILMASDSYKDTAGEHFIADFTAGISYGVKDIFNHADLSLQEALISKISYKVYKNNQSQKQLQEENLNRLKVYKNALHTGKIIPYFQPIVDAKDASIIKYEALARLETDNGEIISPYYFLDAAKEDKTFEFFTRQMMQKVFNIFAKSGVHISMNLTYGNINSPSMVEYIQNRLDKYGGKGITFEILESEDIQDYHVIESFIIMVKEYGCKVSIDDFGSGYSNFTNMLKFNIDYIKIDGSLIEKLNSDQNVRNMVRGLLVYAHNANMKVIAEFVSSEELSEAVKELGIDYMQGYYYGEPKPPEYYGLA